MNIFLPITIGYGVPRPHSFSSNNKITKIHRFGLFWDFRKMAKWLVLSIGVQNMIKGLKKIH